MSRRPAAARLVTPELVRDALAFVAPDMAREEWVRIGMAVKSELGDAGFELWRQWSAQAEGFNERDARDTWRSIKAGGRVRIGTLFHLAQQAGFRFPEEAGPADAAALAAVQAEQQRLAAERLAKEEAEAEKYRARADEAAQTAQRLWSEASEQGSSPYLQRKGVQGHGVRYLGDGTLWVPMRNAEGELQNLQRVLPKRPRDGSPEKRFLPGGRKVGLLHWIGQPAGAPALLLAEGYATAATLHEATGRPVAVCFDAGNLVHVAKALPRCFPGVPLLVCADDDRATEVRGGTNPGRDKAASAARAAIALGSAAHVAVPDGLSEDGSDFNDLAAAAGLDAVRVLVEHAASALLAPPAAADAGADVAAGAEPAADRPKRSRRPALRVVPGGGGDAAASGAHAAASSGSGGGGGGRVPRRGASGSGRDGGNGGSGSAGASSADPFRLDDAGVWHIARDADGSEKRPTWVCAPLLVTARTRADDANGWGNLLEFTDPDGNPKQWAMPSAMLSGEGAEWAARLRDMGLRMAPGTRPRNLLAQYIDTREPPERVTCTDRVGWHGSVYVLPSGCIDGRDDGSDEASDSRHANDGGSDSAEPGERRRRFVFQSESGMEDTFRRHGTLAQWQQHVGALCVGNSRLVFAVSCALAGPMLRLAEVESGGFHFRGESSQGKTTALKVAASVWGRPSYLQRWRTTDNALEATAVQHCDATLILDEFGQLDPRVAGDVAYMLANDQEKARATRGGLARKRRTWRLLFLSSGEVSLAQHMELAAKTPRAGQEVRMLDVPLDAGCGMGGLEALHDHDGPAQLADAMTAAAARLYGTPGHAWLRWAARHFDRLPHRLAELLRKYRDDFVPEAAAEQVRRAGTRFALVAAAGELAGEAGVTGWAPGHAAWAARECFNAWLAARGHLDNGEDAAMLRQARRFLEKNGEALFTWTHRAHDDHRPSTPLRAGFKRLIGDDGKPLRIDAASEYVDARSAEGSRSTDSAAVEFLILSESFRSDVCKGFAAESMAELLRRRGHLEHDEGRLTKQQRLPGMGRVRCYHVRPSIFADEL